MITLNYIGKPKPASRPRVTRFSTYYSKTYETFRKDFKSQIQKQYSEVPLLNAVEVEICFYMPVPTKLKKAEKLSLIGEYCILNGGDIDNLSKAVLDCMNGFIFEDDIQVASLICKKIYSNNPSITTIIKEL